MAVFRLKARGRPDGKIKVFVSRVVTSGWVQRAFANKIGDPVGECVKGKVHEGMTPKEIRDAVKDCAPAKGTIHLSPADAKTGRARRKKKR